jgi:hypothetical protein
MQDTKLYKIVAEGPSEAPSARLEPSEFLLSLSPVEAVAELNAHIKSLEDRLGKFAKVDLKVREEFEKAREVSFEIEMAQDLLRRFKKDLGSSD